MILHLGCLISMLHYVCWVLGMDSLLPFAKSWSWKCVNWDVYTEPFSLFLKKLILVGRQEIRKHGIQAIPAIWNYAYDEETHRGYDLIEIARNIKRKGHSSLGKHQSIAQSNGAAWSFQLHGVRDGWRELCLELRMWCVFSIHTPNNSLAIYFILFMSIHSTVIQ